MIYTKYIVSMYVGNDKMTFILSGNEGHCRLVYRVTLFDLFDIYMYF